MRFLQIISLSLVFIFISHLLYAQSWDVQFQEARELYTQGKYEQAYEKSRTAINTASATYGKNHEAYMYSLQIGMRYAYAVQEPDEAETLGDELLEVMQTIDAPEDAYYAMVLDDLAQIKRELGKYEPAIRLSERYLIVLESMNEKSGIDYANGLYNLGVLHYTLGSEDSASRYLTEALGLYNKFPDALGESYILTLYYLGDIALAASDYDEALKFFKAVKEILINNDLQEWSIFPTVLYSLALVHQSLEQRDDALENYLSLIELLEDHGQHEDEIYVSALNNAASIYQFKGDISSSQTLLAKAGEQLSASGDITSLRNKAAIAFASGDVSHALLLIAPALGSMPQRYEDSIVFAGLLAQAAQYHFALGNTHKADSIYHINKDFILQLEGEHSVAYAKFLQDRGWFYYNTEQVEKGKQLIEQSLRLKKELLGNQSAQLSVTLNSLGVILQQEGKYRAATAYFNDALQIIATTRGKQNTEYAATLNNLGAVKHEAGAFREAEQQFMEALTLINELMGSSHEEYANTWSNLGALYLSLGKREKADSAFVVAQEIYRTQFGKESEPYANILLGRSKVLLAKADFVAAEDLQREALQIIKRINGTQSIAYAAASNDLAFLYQNMGNYDEAEPLLNTSLNIFGHQLGNRHPQYITTLENLATLKQLKGELSRAEELLLEALEADKEVYGTAHPNYAVTLHNLAALYQTTEQIDLAEQFYHEAIAIDREVYGEKHPVFATTMYNLAILYQDKEQLLLADSLMDKVIDIRKEILGEKHPDYTYSLYGKAVLLQKMERNEEAIPLYNQVINEYLFMINEYFPSLSENEKSAYYQTLNPVFNAYKDFALEVSDKYPEMLGHLMDLQLSTKAILLNASNKVRNRILNSNDQELISLFKEWQEIKERIVKYYAYTLEQLNSEGVVLKELEQRANDLERSLSRSSESFAKEFDKKKMSWRDVQSSLKENEALVEIIRLRKNLKNDSIIYVAIILHADTAQKPKAVVMAKGSEIEGRYVNFYKNSIRFKLKDIKSYDHYWKKIDEELDKAKVIYIAPDGVYNKVNLNTLYNPGNGRYLLEDKAFHFLSSSRDLLVNKDDSGEMIDSGITEWHATLIGYPNYNFGLKLDFEESTSLYYSGFRSGVDRLPGTEAEILKLDSILNTMNWSTRVLTDTGATEDALHKAKSPHLLHIATHGFFLEDIREDDMQTAFGIHMQNVRSNPLLRSGLLLAGAELTMLNQSMPDSLRNDGVLTAYETMNLNLDNTRLVVLSACETGLGEVKNGEGVYGLQRAFLVAGAQNLIMSLWKVDDYATQRLMTRFYEKWTSGMGKQEAFKLAQLSLKNEFDHPFYWGAFIMIGK